MYILSYLKWGFGNKFFILLYLLNYFIHAKPKYDKLYIVQTQSHHDKQTKDENFYEIFPNLKKVKFLKFISWNEFDLIKKSTEPYKIININIGVDWYNDIYFLQLRPFIKMYLQINPIYKLINKKYNIDTKKGIAIHYRLGDKAMININKSKLIYIIMKPEYFIDYCKKMLQEENGPIYVFSDSMNVAKYLLQELFDKYSAILIDSNYIETFYLFTKFKRLIISESSISLGAALLNKKGKQIIVPNYYIDVITYKIKKHFLHDKYPNIIKEDNQKYIMQLQDLIKLKKIL